MKKYTIILSLLITMSCKAQKTLSSMQESEVRARLTSYKIIRNPSFIKIENQANRLSNIKAVAPSLPIELATRPLMGVNNQQIMLICAQIISLKKIEKLPKLPADGLSIRIKSSVSGTPIEVSFLTETESILTIEELEQIELSIKKEVKATYFPKMEPFLKDANYINIDIKIGYKDLLNATKKVPSITRGL